jgi:predicted DNA-binding protein
MKIRMSSCPFSFRGRGTGMGPTSPPKEDGTGDRVQGEEKNVLLPSILKAREKLRLIPKIELTIYIIGYIIVYTRCEMSRAKVIFSLDRDIVDELNTVSGELKEKKSHIVEKALALYFDLLDIRLADKRMNDVKKGKSRLIPAKDVYKELGL